VLVETILGVLVISIITSTALGLFSTLLTNFHVHDLITKVNMCITTKSGDYLDFEYQEKDSKIHVIGPIKKKAKVLAKALIKMKQNYNCEFKNEKGEDINLGESVNEDVTGYLWINFETSNPSSV
jgi:hypothetical protein